MSERLQYYPDVVKEEESSFDLDDELEPTDQPSDNPWIDLGGEG